uniref:Death domain-containing protein n=1 Tax=Amphimedon queenslandica TaxID=400682 RepID=A0A1X7V096_AMPQE
MLKKEGKFEKKLLNCLSEGFTKDFTSSDFLSLMESLLIIGPLEEDQYFIPCVLETCAVDVLEKMRRQFSKSCDPLVLSWQDNIIPQGMYPALVVSLLKEGFRMFKRQVPYRNAIKLQSTDLGVNILLVDTIQWLEIHCDGPAGPVQDACPELRVLVQRSIQFVSSKFCYSSNTLEGTLCQTCTAGVCCCNKSGTSITCTNGNCSKAREMGPRQSCWFKPRATDSVSCGAPADELLSDRSTSKKKTPELKQLMKIFMPSVHHYELIGIGLDVDVSDLQPLPTMTATNLRLVFQRWIDSGEDVNWDKLVEVCDDFPVQLGNAKNKLENFLS